jgi:hypothetical protein
MKLFVTFEYPIDDPDALANTLTFHVIGSQVSAVLSTT